MSISAGNSLHLFHVVGNFLSKWHHLSFHLSVGFLQILLKRMCGGLPGACHILDLGHVDGDGQLSGLDDAQKDDDGCNNFHIGMFFKSIKNNINENI